MFARLQKSPILTGSFYKARHTRWRYSMKTLNPSGLTNKFRGWRLFPFSKVVSDSLERHARTPAERRALLGAYLLIGWACQPPPVKETIWVTIPADATLEAVADSLVNNGIIQSSQAFQRLARMGRAHLDIKPGLYDFQLKSPMGEVLVRLRQGTDPVKRLVLPEGIWLTEVAAWIEREMGIDREAFLAAAESPARLSRLGTRGESAEGYIYPSVYYLREGPARTRSWTRSPTLSRLTGIRHGINDRIHWTSLGTKS